MKTIKAISIKLDSEEFIVELSGNWSEEACHKMIQNEYPNIHSNSYELLYDYERNCSCNWGD